MAVTPEGCPCEAVRKLEGIIDRHDRELAQGNTDFAVIRSDINYIKAKLDEKSRFNSQTISAIIQAVCTLLVALIAARLGLQ